MRLACSRHTAPPCSSVQLVATSQDPAGSIQSAPTRQVGSSLFNASLRSAPFLSRRRAYSPQSRIFPLDSSTQVYIESQLLDTPARFCVSLYPVLSDRPNRFSSARNSPTFPTHSGLHRSTRQFCSRQPSPARLAFRANPARLLHSIPLPIAHFRLTPTYHRQSDLFQSFLLDEPPLLRAAPHYSEQLRSVLADNSSRLRSCLSSKSLRTDYSVLRYAQRHYTHRRANSVQDWSQHFPPTNQGEKSAKYLR